MLQRTMGWGVLGATSRIAGDAVIPAISRCAGARLAAVASRDMQNAAAIAAQYGTGVRAYGDYDSLLADENVDVVYIPLPNSLHAGWAIEAMNNGKHVLCEQPLALNAAEAQEMADTADENGVVLSEAFMFLYHPLQTQVFDRVRQGQIGTVSLIKASYSFVQSEMNDFRRDPDMGGGALLDIGGYCVHIARSAFGSEPVAVTAKSLTDPAAGIDTSTTAQMDFSGGGTALIDCSFAQTFRASYEIVGDLGAISVAQFCPARGKNAEYLLSMNGKEPETVTVAEADMYEEEVCAMTSRLCGEDVFLLSASDAVNNMRALDAVALSARSGGIKIVLDS